MMLHSAMLIAQPVRRLAGRAREGGGEHAEGRIEILPEVARPRSACTTAGAKKMVAAGLAAPDRAVDAERQQQSEHVLHDGERGRDDRACGPAPPRPPGRASSATKLPKPTKRIVGEKPSQSVKASPAPRTRRNERGEDVEGETRNDEPPDARPAREPRAERRRGVAKQRAG